MPTYSYACTECDHKFDTVQAFTDDALTSCPECSGRLRKLFNSVGVVFKGSGFYRTDSREPAKSESAGGSPGESAPAAKTEAPAAPAKSPAPASPSKPSSASSGSSSPAPATTG